MPMYFLNIYKEKGMTSFDVIHKLRKILNIKKIGHSGTLDPLAQVVLQIGVGGASRLLEYLDEDKSYKAQIKFGYTTDTLDSEGEKNFIAAPDFSESDLIETLEKFKVCVTIKPLEAPFSGASSSKADRAACFGGRDLFCSAEKRMESYGLQNQRRLHFLRHLRRRLPGQRHL